MNTGIPIPKIYKFYRCSSNCPERKLHDLSINFVTIVRLSTISFLQPIIGLVLLNLTQFFSIKRHLQMFFSEKKTI